MIPSMRSFSFAVIFQTFLVLVAVVRVGAGPLSVQRRNTLDVYNPAILQPTASSNWTAGAQEVVRWDTTDAPKSISNQGHVVLKTIPVNSNEVSKWRHLAGPFDLTTGQIDITIPEDVITGKYAIILFGNSGNESPAFHVNGKYDGHPPTNDNDEHLDSKGPRPNKGNSRSL